MIFYNLDGTLKRCRSESVFGWWLQDFIVDENVDNHEDINHDRKKSFAKESLNQNSQDYFEVLVELQEPNIKLAPIQSVENTIITNSSKGLKTEKFLDCRDLLNQIIDFGPSKDNGDKLETNRNSINPDILNNKLECSNSNNLQANKTKNFCEITSKMQSDLHTIRKYFEQEEERVKNLVKESIKLREDIQECNYLDDVLLLLMGEVDKVKSFKFNDSENLII